MTKEAGRLIMIMMTKQDNSSIVSHRSWSSLLAVGAMRP